MRVKDKELRAAIKLGLRTLIIQEVRLLTSWMIRVLSPNLIAALNSLSFTGIEISYQKMRAIARETKSISPDTGPS